ncbi:hypothetical protein ACEUA0_11715, partial [Aeromonas veronii]
DSQAVRSLSAGMAEGRGQCLHRENRLPAPGRVVVNILPVNGYDNSGAKGDWITTSKTTKIMPPKGGIIQSLNLTN